MGESVLPLIFTWVLGIELKLPILLIKWLYPLSCLTGDFFFFFSKLQSVKVLYYNTVLCFTLVLHIKHSEIFTYITLEIDLIMGLKLHPDCSGIVREVSAHVFFCCIPGCGLASNKG